MKSRKLLFGLFVAAFVGGGHFVSAQPKANYQNNLVEIGPANIAGRVRAIVVDEADANHSTLYAGGVAGGLYKKVGDKNWNYVPYISNGKEVTLPISCMIQLPDNSLLIGTGEGFVSLHGNNYDRMAPKGRGIYRFKPEDGSFSLINGTNPASYANFEFVNRMACLEREVNGTTYWFVYAATGNGLYRWKVNAATGEFTGNPTLVVSGEFHDVIIISADNIAYASAPGKLYRIGNVTGESQAVDVTNSNSAFANASRIELAANTAHTRNSSGGYDHTTYLYAVVADANGLLDGVYITKDQQNWNILSTSTVVPFNAENPGNINASIAIDPRNYKHILVGGATLWNGEGFLENGYYQWTKQSYSESELNGGNYMSNVYSTPVFLHSGIHQILPTWVIENGDTVWTTYYATDAGVYQNFNNSISLFRSLNNGLNTVQFNSIAVSPDGSILGGAVDNSCPFIQSRNSHNVSNPIGNSTWYDNDSNSIMNHLANIIWFGNGGGVATSQFQQVTPLVRRNLFVSSESGRFTVETNMGIQPVASYGRGCTDYTDYTNTQTWTIGSSFLSNMVYSNPAVPTVKIWETTNNTVWNDSVTFTIDTNLTIIRGGQEVAINGDFQIKAGDSILVPSVANFSYPFYHKFTSSFTVKDNMRHTVPSPVVSRMIVSATTSDGKGAVFMTTTPNDYRKVWDKDESASHDPATLARLMYWNNVYTSDLGWRIADMAFSTNGKDIYVAVVEDSTNRSFVFHLYDFCNANVNDMSALKSQITWRPDNELDLNNPRITHYDTIVDANGDFFSRPITSLSVDPRNGKDVLLITFGGYDNSGANIVCVKNASNKKTRTISNMNITNSANSMQASDPVYSALIEYTTGAVYVGTEKGVFTADSVLSSSWQNYAAFDGVPVTSIVQQTNNMKRQRYVTREGVNDVTYIFAKTKYPYAIYFGTYGRGVFMDSTYVTDHENEVTNPEDWLGITTVDNGENSMRIYPNPVSDNATVELSIVNSGNAVVRIFDVSGKMVHIENLGYLNEGVHRYSINCQKFNHGMYLVNVNIGKESATSKLIVR